MHGTTNGFMQKAEEIVVASGVELISSVVIEPYKGTAPILAG
jgi:hypothetical protein